VVRDHLPGEPYLVVIAGSPVAYDRESQAVFDGFDAEDR
jgi:hypothetical protein